MPTLTQIHSHSLLFFSHEFPSLPVIISVSVPGAENSFWDSIKSCCSVNLNRIHPTMRRVLCHLSFHSCTCGYWGMRCPQHLQELTRFPCLGSHVRAAPVDGCLLLLGHCRTIGQLCLCSAIFITGWQAQGRPTLDCYTQMVRTSILYHWTNPSPLFESLEARQCPVSPLIPPPKAALGFAYHGFPVLLHWGHLFLSDWRTQAHWPCSH